MKLKRFDEKLENNESYFLITYAESGDEIHFILMSMNKWDYINEKNINLYSENMDYVNDLIEYIHNNKVSSKWVQTYTNDDWFKDYKIEKVIYIPELGM